MTLTIALTITALLALVAAIADWRLTGARMSSTLGAMALLAAVVDAVLFGKYESAGAVAVIAVSTWRAESW